MQGIQISQRQLTTLEFFDGWLAAKAPDIHRKFVECGLDEIYQTPNRLNRDQRQAGTQRAANEAGRAPASINTAMVTDLLKQNPKGMTTAQIAEALRTTAARVGTVLRNSMEKKQLVRLSGQLWKLTGKVAAIDTGPTARQQRGRQPAAAKEGTQTGAGAQQQQIVQQQIDQQREQAAAG